MILSEITITYFHIWNVQTSDHKQDIQNFAMALAHGRQVQVAQEGDVTVGRVVDTVIDTETGIVAERERIAVQVPTEDGGTALVIGEKIRATRVVRYTNLFIFSQ